MSTLVDFGFTGTQVRTFWHDGWFNVLGGSREVLVLLDRVGQGWELRLERISTTKLSALWTCPARCRCGDGKPHSGGKMVEHGPIPLPERYAGEAARGGRQAQRVLFDLTMMAGRVVYKFNPVLDGERPVGMHLVVSGVDAGRGTPVLEDRLVWGGEQ